MSIVIHHNPDCGTSRNVLAIIRASGAEPVAIDYLQTGWTRGQLLGLFAAAGLTPRTALRVVCSPKGVRLCRPSEKVLDLLDKLPPGPMAKEDGTPLIDAAGRRVG